MIRELFRFIFLTHVTSLLMKLVRFLAKNNKKNFYSYFFKITIRKNIRVGYELFKFV